MKQDSYLGDLAKAWPSPYVTRSKIGIFSGGMVSPASMAVFDCEGKGIAERFIINRKTCYKVVDVIAWLESRVVRR